jgi:serine/threonine protein kinase
MLPSLDTDTKVISINKEDDSFDIEALDALKRLTPKPQGRYKFLHSIGFGGNKGVILVHDKDTEREVAMAIMPDFSDRSKDDLERFLREAFITARLEHPNIVPVHDIGIDESGSPFFTMKYLRGAPLSTILNRLANHDANTVERYNLNRLLQVFIRICNAVAFAHSKGYCHLDLKPANVNIDNFGEVVLLDWGLAAKIDEKGFVDPAKISGTFGTPGFIAPEQFAHEFHIAPGVRSDIYALGAILYTILALKIPAVGNSTETMLKGVLERNLKAPSEVAPKDRYVPESLEAIVTKAMNIHPLSRYESVLDLKNDVLAYMAGFATVAENASFTKKFYLFTHRNQAYIAIIVSIIALLLSIFIFILIVK